MKKILSKQTIGTALAVIMIQGFAWSQISSLDSSQESHLTDTQMGRKVHSALVEDTALPFCAHVVRVKAKDGKVTLVGHVHTEAQKEEVGEKAATIAGDDNVINNVEVKTHKSTALVMKDAQ